MKEEKSMTTDISVERRNQLWEQAQVNGRTDDDLYARLLEQEEKNMTTETKAGQRFYAQGSAVRVRRWDTEGNEHDEHVLDLSTYEQADALISDLNAGGPQRIWIEQVGLRNFVRRGYGECYAEPSATTTEYVRARAPQPAPDAERSSQKPIPLSDWIALCDALEATPDIKPADLASKARAVVESRRKYARTALENVPAPVAETYQCDACGKVVPESEVKSAMPSAGVEGTFCHECRHGKGCDCLPAPDAEGEWRVHFKTPQNVLTVEHAASGYEVARLPNTAVGFACAERIVSDHRAVPLLVKALEAALPKCDHVTNRDTGVKCGAIASWLGSFSSHYCEEHKRQDNLLMEVVAQGIAALASVRGETQ